MRNLRVSLVASALVILLAACGGPSGKEMTRAKQARFTGDKATIFAGAKAVTEAKYKLDKVDENAAGLQTVGRWYMTDGMLAPGSDADMRQVPDKSIRLVLVVRVLPDGDNWKVEVEPSMLRKLSGSPAPQKLEKTDPDYPGFIQGQVDTLLFEIWNGLKAYEVKTPGGVVPAGPATDGSADSAAPTTVEPTNTN